MVTPFWNKPLRDVDAGERAHRIRLFLYAAAGGVTGFFAVPFYVSQTTDSGPVLLVLSALGGWAGATALIFGFGFLLLEASASAAGTLIFPAGSAPPLRTFAKAESLVIRGQFEEAAAAYEAAALSDPSDPEAPLRLGRLLRDEIHRPEEALEWFRRARDLAASDRGRDVAVTREIVELYTHRLNAPTRALPELARAAERWRGTPQAEWAQRQLAEWKAVVHGGSAEPADGQRAASAEEGPL